MKSSKNNYVYILQCRDGSLYTGWTNKLVDRVKTHNQGRGAKYTRGRLPCELIYFEVYPSKSLALKREYAIKQLPRYSKLKLVEDFEIPKDIRERLA